MIAGTYEKALREEMIRMGVSMHLGPSDMSSPHSGKAERHK